MRFRSGLVAVVVVGLWACVPRTPQPVQTPPVAAPPPARPAPPVSTPVPARTIPTWMDQPQTPGDWSYSKSTAGSSATFADFSLSCTAARTVELTRGGAASASNVMTVRTEAKTQGLTAAPNSDGTALRAVLSARDPLLDAMAFSKGRFAIEVAGQPTLYLPSWPEVTRVIEDCRA